MTRGHEGGGSQWDQYPDKDRHQIALWPFLFTVWGHSKKAALCKPRRGLSWRAELAGTLSSDLQPPRSVRNEFHLV